MGSENDRYKPLERQVSTHVVRYRLDLRQGDVQALEVVELDLGIRLAVYDRESTKLPLIHAELDEKELSDLLLMLLGNARHRRVGK